MLKKVVQLGLEKFGFHILKLPRYSAKYENLLPVGTYSPWNSDTEFLAAYNAVKAHTLVDIYRCWELWTLAKEVAHRGGAIVEVGVWRGGTGALMGKASQLAGNNAPLYLCDTFEGVVKAGPNDTDYKGGEHHDATQAVVEQLLQKLGVNSYRILKGIFPEQTSNLIPPDERIGLCHIDVDVYQSSKDATAWLWPKLVPGGAIVYDDYGYHMCPGVTKFVDEQRRERDRVVLYNLNGHAAVVKVAA